MDELTPKKYTLVRDPNNKLYAVASNEVVDLEGPNSPVPSSVAEQVHGDLDGPDGVEHTVQARLAPYLPQGSGVRVRVPKILD
jgi:hypothetical protein